MDIEGFSDQGRTNLHRLTVREGLYHALQEAFHATGVSWHDCDHEDRGDGVFVLIPPNVAKSVLVESLPRYLATALQRHNEAHQPPEQIRLRMALHAGEITYDEHGAAGASINMAFRLIEAKPLKAALSASPTVLVLIVSSWFFDEVVRHSTNVNSTSYRPCTVTVKETTTTAWIFIPELSRPRPANTLPQRTITALHLSGLRFGRTDVPSDEMARLLLDAVLRTATAPQWAPDLVLVTGDLAEHGRRSEYELFANFLLTTLDRLGLPRHRAAIVPGRRDVNLAACRAYFDACESDEVVPAPPYWPKWKHFERMFTDFYGTSATFAVGQEWSLFVIDDLQTVIAGYNTTMAVTHQTPRQEAHIGSAQAEWFDRHLHRFERQGWLRLAATYDKAELSPRLNLALTQLPATSPVGYRFLRFERDGFTQRSGTSAEDDGKVARHWYAVDSTFPPEPASSPAGRFKLLTDDTAELHRIAELTELAESEKTRDRERFLVRVAEIARLRHGRRSDRTAITEISPTMDSPGYLRVTCSDGAIVTQHPVGTCEGDVDEETMRLFAERVHQIYAATDPQLVSELVYGGQRASTKLISEARGAGVRLVSFVEYEGLLDLRDYITAQTQRLTHDPLYPPSLYLPQRIRNLGRGSATRHDDALAQVIDWLATDQARFVLLLGDFGRGKTFLLHELARTMPERLPHVMPLLVELRHLEKSHGIDELVAAHLMSSGVEVFDRTMFRYMLRQGRIALLFDGFDELALRITYERAADHLETLFEALDGRAKIVLTSRSQHFRSDQQVRTALGQRVEVLTASRIANIEDFTDSQIARFLTNFYHGDEAKAAARLDLIRNIHDLLGLSRNPRMLGFIARLDNARLLEVQARTGTITSADLYQELIDSWLDHEASRAPRAGAAPSLTKADKMNALTALAVRLWQSADQTISLAELADTTGQVLTTLDAHGLDRGQAAHQMGSGTLLVRTEEDTFTFIHASAMEFLVAVAIALGTGDIGSMKLLGLRPMSRLMADFVVGLADRRLIAQWLRDTFGNPSASASARTNAISIARILDPSCTREARLQDANLVAADLCDLDLSGADLSGADLTDARLIRATLQGAQLSGAKLVRARIEHADLTGANLNRADLTDARLISCTLRQVNLDESRWTRASLLGCELSDVVEDLEAAAVVGLDRPVLVVPPGADVRCIAFSPDGSLVAYGSGSTLTLVDARTERILRANTDHLGFVWAVAFSPDGTTVATASSDTTARLWNVATGTCRHVLGGHSGPVVALAFSPDGTILATGSDDTSVRLWNTATGACEHALVDHADRIRAVAFSPDGTVLATASDDATVRLWHVETGTCQYILTGHTEPVLTLAFSPTNTLATGSRDNTTRLWNVETGICHHVLAEHQGPVLKTAFATDGTILATASNDTTVRLWHVETGTCQYILTGHTEPVLTLAFSPTNTLATGSRDNTTRLWNTTTGQCQHILTEHTNMVWTLAFSPDGYTLATGSGDLSVRLWDVESYTCRRALTKDVKVIWTVAFSPDGMTIATGGKDSTARLWDLSTGKCRSTFAGHTGPLWKLAFSPDGTTLATASRDGTIRLWDVENETCRHILTDHTNRIRDVMFSPDSRTLASASDDTTARIWDTSTGQCQYVLTGHSNHVSVVVFSPDGTTVATASDDATVRLWRTATGACQHVLSDHTDRIRDVTFSPDGTTVATSSDDTTARLWNTTTGTCQHVLSNHTGSVWKLAFSPDGMVLASGSDDTTARLWDTTTGTCRHTLTAHTGSVWKLAFAPDSTVLATGSDDTTARLWNTTSGQCQHTLTKHTGWIINVLFSPDGTTLATTGTDNTTRLWSSETGDAIAVMVGLQDTGWAVLWPDGRYATSGRVGDEFWWAVKLCRFGQGELDRYVPSVRAI